MRSASSERWAEARSVRHGGTKDTGRCVPRPLGAGGGVHHLLPVPHLTVSQHDGFTQPPQPLTLKPLHPSPTSPCF
ncbi:unnamed protein product [Arctogadus glacialis]